MNNLVELTNKQKRFIELYTQDKNFNAKEAMKEAGYNYSSEAAWRTAVREMLANPKIKRVLNESISDREKSVQVDKYWVVEKLKKIVLQNEDKNYPNQLKALELLGKYLGMFSDKVVIGEEKNIVEAARNVFAKRKAEIEKQKEDDERKKIMSVFSTLKEGTNGSTIEEGSNSSTGAQDPTVSKGSV
jgi:phage terminase small subunit